MSSYLSIQIEVDHFHGRRGCPRARKLIKDGKHPATCNPSAVDSDFSKRIQPLGNPVVGQRPVGPPRCLAGGDDTDIGQDHVRVVVLVEDDLRAADGVERKWDFHLGERAIGAAEHMEGACE